MPHEDSAQAAQILLRRRNARRSLLSFTNYTFPQYIAEPAHAKIAATLDRCVQGAIHKLMIFAPPQHGKSELVSVRFPTYWLGHHPNDPVVLTSYGASLAEFKSRQARQIVESADYARLFPHVTTDIGSRAVNNWRLAPPQRGGMLAAGVGGPITGHGAMLGIIDDPFENWEQAQSQTVRDRVWEWYKGTFRTRIWENGIIILIMTRWHEDDLAGRLLAEQGDEWTVLRLAARAESQPERDENNRRLGIAAGEPDPLAREPGMPLTPRRFSDEALHGIERDVGSLVWSAEYQGVPRSLEGNRFKRHWFEVIDALPATIKRRVRYWDNAATEAGGCYTVGLLLAETADQHYIVEDVVRGQWSSDQRNQIVKQTAALDAERGRTVSAQGAGSGKSNARPNENETERLLPNAVQIYVEQEPGSAGIDAIRAITKLLTGYPVRADHPTGSKDVRLEPYAAQCEVGNVKLLRGAWNLAYIDEMCAVPNGKYRDQADASAGAFNRLANRKGFGLA